MQLREPIQNFFGTADKNALLNDGAYSAQELKEDKVRLKRQRQSIQKEMDQFKEEYKELLRKGSEADSLDRQRIAQQAKMAKKKFKIKKQQYKKNSVVLGTVVTIEGARELMEMHDDGNSTNIEGIIESRDIDTQQVQEQMMDQMVQFELDIGVMQDIQESLDLDLLSTDMDIEGGEEIEKMEDMAAGNISAEQVDIEEEVDVDTEDALESGIDEDLGDIDDDLGY